MSQASTPEAKAGYTPNGFPLIPGCYANFPLSATGRTVEVGGESITIEPANIIRGWQAHAPSELSARVNSYQPEFHYAKALWEALDNIAGMWKGLDRNRFNAVVAWGANGRVLEICWDTKNNSRRVISSYDLGFEGAYPTEWTVDTFKRNNFTASSLSVLVPGERWPLLNVLSPRIADGREPYGHIRIDSSKYVPDFFGKLTGVDMAKMESVTKYVQNLKQALQ